MTLDETLDYLAAQIEKIFRVGTEKIGIGVPSVVDVKQGIVYDTQNIPSWTEVPLKEHLEKRFGVPVDVNNDANCFAMGVYGTYPADAKPETLVVVTLGTGVGMGIVIDGRLFCGANCGAGELGCLPFKDGILEDYCSKKFFTGAGWDSRDLAEKAKEGDPDALLLFDEFGQNLGALVCTVMYAYDPRAPPVRRVRPEPGRPRLHRHVRLRSHAHRPRRRYREQLSLLPPGHGRIHPRELPVPEGRRAAHHRHLYGRYHSGPRSIFDLDSGSSPE